MRRPAWAAPVVDGRTIRPRARAGTLPRLATIFALLSAMAGHAAAQPLDRGWWVVVGSIPAPGNNLLPFPTVNRAAMAARRCGMESYSDFSGKFQGFAPEFLVTVVGAYPTRTEAEAALARLRPCVPEAYIRRGEYAGD